MRRRGLWFAGLLLLALVLALPLLLNLDIFLGRIHRALERQLGRPVELTSLTGRLLPRPAFVGRGVRVLDREEFGAEPLLYADEVRCDLSLGSLGSLRIECARIDFLRPSINLVRNRKHDWNLESFLGTTAPASSAPANPRPSARPLLTARDARINFKLGNDKQVFALLVSRLRMEPQPDRSWRLSLRARPMRTDRRLAEIGALTLEGTFGRRPGSPAAPTVQFNLGLESGSLAQLWTLITGDEPPFRGTSQLSARLEGTRGEWRARGTLTLSELRRWDLLALPHAPSWNADFVLRSQSDSTLVLESVTLRGRRSELSLNGTVTGLFRQPAWEVEARSERLALGELAAQLAAFREGVSPDARLEGTARLQLRLAGPLQNWEGECSIPEGARLVLPESPPVEISALSLRLARGRVELSPLTLHYSPEHRLGLQGELILASAPYPYRLRWESEEVRLDALRRTAAAFGWSLFGAARWRGRARLALEWRGQLSGAEPPRWQGEVSLAEASYQPTELNYPLEIPEARLSWRGPRLEARPLKIRLGEDELSLTLEQPGRPNRWLLTAETPRLTLDALDGLLNPARQGLISRLVRPASRADPAWRQLDLTGTIKLGELLVGPFRLSQFEAQADWQGGWLELTRLRFGAHGGQFSGRLHADFRGGPPRYRLAGNLKQVMLNDLLAGNPSLAELYSGLLGADLALETGGTRPRELLRGLRGRVVGVLHNGVIRHISLVDSMAAAVGGAEPDEGGSANTTLQSLAGEFQVAEEKVRLDAVRMITSRAALELSGTVDFEGRLDLRLVGEPLRVAGRQPSPRVARALARSYRLTGTLRRPQLELGEPLPAPAATQR